MDTKKPRTADDDPDAPATAEERAASERLRDALGDTGIPSDEADLARALSLGFEPREIAPDEHRAIVLRAMGTLGARPKRGKVIRVAFGLGAAGALAAGILFSLLDTFPATRTDPAGRAATRALVATRSTQPLFDATFAPRGGESSRIDRIAMARSADLRENRFAQWGVR